MIGFAGAAFVLLGLLPTAIERPVNVTCNANLVCVKTYEHVRLDLESYTAKPLSVRLFFTTPNMIHVRPPTLHLDSPSTQTIVTFEPPIGSWGYERFFGGSGFWADLRSR